MNIYAKIFLIFILCSPLYYYFSKLFAYSVEFIGGKSGFIKNAGFMMAGLAMGAICIGPFLFGVFSASDYYPPKFGPLIAVFILFPISLIPSIIFVRKNIEIFYSAGYWKRLE